MYNGEKNMQTNKKQKCRFRQAISLALLSLLICGIFFPLLVTGLAQVFFPNQANGEIVQFNGQAVGSNLIAQNFTLPIFFHPRNDSASGVDPHITLEDAYSQISRIQNATGISQDLLTQIVNENKEGTYWIFGSPYVNVLRLNLALIKTYPSVYNVFQ
jgi:potassium-transporting ATPase KdpC subunit